MPGSNDRGWVEPVHKPRTTMAMESIELRDGLFGPETMDRLRGLVDLDDRLLSPLDSEDAARALARTEILITSWGTPRITAELLDRAPRLRAVVHSAGSVKWWVDPVAWQRGVLVSSAATANAQPVAEYTLAMIILAGKRVLWPASHDPRGGWNPLQQVGNYGTTVGIVGASRTGRRVIEMLAALDVDVLVYDPWVGERELAGRAELVGSLIELAERSDVLSVHAPALPETRHMIDAPVLAAMCEGAVLINTARGSLLDHEALRHEIQRRPLYAVLDVTDPEPLPPSDPLLSHPAVLLTPHVAGSAGNELRRLGRSAVDEVERLVGGLPLRHAVAQAELAVSA
ncbi:hydroxyacid dehydrogenase [Ruania alkalisoli]|nr:hydroxyacid dehydrogenase [Ruania alkalisoli]